MRIVTLDLSLHNLEGLFAQLGLDTTDNGIKDFIANNKTINVC